MSKRVLRFRTTGSNPSSPSCRTMPDQMHQSVPIAHRGDEDNGSCSLDDVLFVPAAETNPQTETVQTMATAVETITNVRPRLEGSGPACDGWMFITRNITTVCGYGVTCGGVHGADEWVDQESLRRITEVYAHTILRYFG